YFICRAGLHIVAPKLFDNIVARPHGERHHRQRGVLAALGDEAGAVGDEEILNVPALIEFVEHRSFRVVAHSGRADLVNAQPGIGQVLVGVLYFPAGGRDHFLHRFDLVFGHLAFVVAVCAFDVRDRDTPGVFPVLVDGHAVFRARQHLAERAHPERRRVWRFAHQTFEFGAEAGGVTHVRGVHSLYRRGLDAVATDEFWVFVEDVSELRDVDSIVAPVAVIIGVFRHGGHYAADADRVGVIHQVMPQHAR